MPLVLPREKLAALVGAGPVSIDLAAQTVAAGAVMFAFAIDAEAKAMLLGGLDAIDLTMLSADLIAAWQARNRMERPWVYLLNEPRIQI